jgi:hypothetical protein
MNEAYTNWGTSRTSSYTSQHDVNHRRSAGVNHLFVTYLLQNLKVQVRPNFEEGKVRVRVRSLGCRRGSRGDGAHRRSDPRPLARVRIVLRAEGLPAKL